MEGSFKSSPKNLQDLYEPKIDSAATMLPFEELEKTLRCDLKSLSDELELEMQKLGRRLYDLRIEITESRR